MQNSQPEAQGSIFENRNEKTSLLEMDFIESFSELEKIEEDWRALDKSAGKAHQVFQTYPWCWHWANHAANGDSSAWRLKILTGRRSGKLVLICPLAIPFGTLLNEARWLGEPLTQYGDVLVADDPARDVWLLEAWRHLLEQDDIDLLHLRKVRTDATIHRLLKDQAYKLPGNQGAPSLNLKPYKDFEELNNTFPGKDRRDRRRKRRRLAELGKLKFEMLNPGPKANAALTTAIEFKNAWLKKSGRHNSAFNDDTTIATLHAILRGEGPSVDSLISIMHLDAEPLAVEIGFINDRTYFTHIGAFNPWFYVHSPGKIMTEDTLSILINRGFEAYDLMAPADDYKLRWSDTLVDIQDHAMPLSLRGVTHMGLYLKLVRPGLKSLYGKLPTLFQRQVARFT